jgi:hypothetical protein
MELRVHGVSGTPPEDLLDRPLVAQVAGDRIAGFYRPRLAEERCDVGPDPFAEPQPDAAQLVGYSWGGLTSGSPGRAIWLLLLPFTLVNIAPRARSPYRAPEGWSTRLIWYLCRLLALALTLMLVMAAVGIGEDLIGWQCVESNYCGKASPYLIFRGLSQAHHLAIERMLLLGSLVPVALLSVLWLASARKASMYESTLADVSPLGERPNPDDTERNRVEVGLGSTLMWQNAAPVRRLRLLHVQCGLALILWMVAAPTEPNWHRHQGISVLGDHPMFFLTAVVVLYGNVALASSAYTGYRNSAVPRVAVWVAWLLLAAGIGWTVIRMFSGRAQVNPSFSHTVSQDRLPIGGLPYFAVTALAICGWALLVLLLLSLVVIAARFGGSRPVPRAPQSPLSPALGGLMTAVFAALGVFLAAAFSAGSYIFAATWLHTGALKPSYHQVLATYRLFVIPPVLSTATLAYTFAVAGLAVVLVGWLLWIGFRLLVRPNSDAAFAADYPSQLDPTTAADRSRSKAIRRAMFLGGLADRAAWFGGPLVLLGAVIVAFFATLLIRHPRTPVVEFLGARTGNWSPTYLSGIGSYLAVMTIVALIAVGLAAYRVPATRRVVGILWDIAAFWPRTCHPLAPPCYAERTVPDLITYITHERVRHPDGVLVLAGHSQGSVISAATIFQLRTIDSTVEHDRTLPGGTLARIAFLSFGCVIRRLYGRYFPVYFGPARLRELQECLSVDAASSLQPRWRNLWRYTDYLGGQITTGPPFRTPGQPAADPEVSWEWHRPDPSLFERPPGDTAYRKTLRHSDYWADRSGYFQEAVRSLVEQTAGSDKSGTPRNPSTGLPTGDAHTGDQLGAPGGIRTHTPFGNGV